MLQRQKNGLLLPVRLVAYLPLLAALPLASNRLAPMWLLLFLCVWVLSSRVLTAKDWLAVAGVGFRELVLRYSLLLVLLYGAIRVFAACLSLELTDSYLATVDRWVSSGCTSEASNFSHAGILDWVRALVFYVVFIVALTFGNRTDFRLILAESLLIYLLISFLLLFVWILRSELLLGFPSTFANQNHFASFSLMAGAFLLFTNAQFQGQKIADQQAVENTFLVKNLLQKGWLGYSAAAYGFFLLLTGSRGAFLAFLACGFLFLGLVCKKESGLNRCARQTRMLLGLSFSAALLLGLTVFLFGTSPLMEVFQSTRLTLWASVWRMVEEAPVFGIGPGTFEYVFPAYKSFGVEMVKYRYAHNDYLEFIVEYGVVGALLLAPAGLAFLSVLGSLLQGQKSDLFLGVGMIGFSLHMFVEFSFQIPAAGILFVLLLGVTIARVRDWPSQPRRSRSISFKEAA